MIRIATRDGRMGAYRILTEVSSAGFILSPVIRETAEFAMLNKIGDNGRGSAVGSLDGAQVASIEIAQSDAIQRLFQPQFQWQLSALRSPQK
jgi:hypothetical protein